MQPSTERNKLMIAVPPASRAVVATLYNNAVVGSAAGVDVRGFDTAELHMSFGALTAGMTDTLTVQASAAASNPGDLTDLVGGPAIYTPVQASDGNSIRVANINLKNLPAGKFYLYVKHFKNDTNATNIGVNLLLGDPKQVIPANDNVAVYSL